MSERAEGKWEVGLGDNNESVFAQSPYQSKVAANGSLVAICYGKNAKDNAKYIVKCENAFEEGGSHSKLLDACKFLADTFPEDTFEQLDELDFQNRSYRIWESVRMSVKAIAAQAEVK